MAAPDEVNSFHQQIILTIDDLIGKGGNVMAHCRGGIGRAGTVAACYLIYKLKVSAAEAINITR